MLSFCLEQKVREKSSFSISIVVGKIKSSRKSTITCFRLSYEIFSHKKKPPKWINPPYFVGKLRDFFNKCSFNQILMHWKLFSFCVRHEPLFPRNTHQTLPRHTEANCRSHSSLSCYNRVHSSRRKALLRFSVIYTKTGKRTWILISSKRTIQLWPNEMCITHTNSDQPLPLCQALHTPPPLGTRWQLGIIQSQVFNYI